ncbi:DNA cytosine methyltransferase [Streptomyces jumonjinensis]|uniref:DNA (cytosine-5-)-methyltransferase n=1 Tax=Streptomyces jumonjinensis TaxID=1945 RepID=A0A646KD38_STRJU|nr:DNA cytosine methyltransferase [Streptomyces jumonjinensis]
MLARTPSDDAHDCPARVFRGRSEPAPSTPPSTPSSTPSPAPALSAFPRSPAICPAYAQRDASVSGSSPGKPAPSRTIGRVTAALASVPGITSLPSGQALFEVAEFFAGIGLARLGLESGGFKVTWANDLDAQKRDMYKGHFADPEDHYILRDIREIADDIRSPLAPRRADLAWASFPCTDLSLAGGRSGLAGEHSSTFWNFTDVVAAMGDRDGETPAVIALENVNGFATSHKGADMKAAVERLNKLGYWADVVTLDARRFVPQSRPRLFVVASRLPKPLADERRDTELRPSWLDRALDDESIDTHRTLLPEPPPLRGAGWTDLVDADDDPSVEWWDAERVAHFESQLSGINKARVEQLGREPEPSYRTAYRRTRGGVPAWEIRDGDVAGCLRTARGGSSKQAVVRMQKGEPLRVRWMTAREYAKLMGAPEYALPAKRNQAIMGFGDAVCVDAVAWLARHYLQPLLTGTLRPEPLPGQQTVSA